MQDKFLKRIVILVEDASTIGGIQTRTLKTIRNATDRQVEYFCLSIEHVNRMDFAAGLEDRFLAVSGDVARALKIIGSWDRGDTVIWFSNNTLSRFPDDVRSALEEFPLVFVGAGQLSFHIQYGRELQDPDFVRNFRTSGMMVLSRLDKLTYNQFGIYGQKIGFNPVEIREESSWTFSENRAPTYIGRIKDGIKGTDRLIPIARYLANNSRGPLRIFTPSSGVDPKEIDRLLDLARKEGVEDVLDVRFDERNLDAMLAEASVLLLPSRLEAFGNVILEAFSYGVPVASSAHAPGPSELIDHGETGFLLENYDTEEFDEIFMHIDNEKMATEMSMRCFEKHNGFSVKKYLDLLESYSREILGEFDGRNHRVVFPYIPARPGSVLKSARITAAMIKGRIIRKLKKACG